MMTVSEAVVASWKMPLVIGHRGAAASMPENTLPSFEAAIAAGAVGVECDVHMSRDGVPVVIHDSTLDRTTKLTGPVSDRDAKELQSAGLPTLGEYLDLVRNRAIAVVEIKDGEGVVAATVAELRKRKMAPQTVVFSFEAKYLVEAKTLDRSLFTARLSSVALPLQDVGTNAISLGYPAVDQKVAAEARKRHMPLFVWTVPPGAEIDRLKGLGANFLITNHPREVRDQLRQGL